MLEERTENFAISIIKLSCSLPTTTEGRVIRSQITRSGTSIGANYREANRAVSRAEFKYKIKICESEASETYYWIRVISKMSWLDENRLAEVKKESNELLALFTSISHRFKNANNSQFKGTLNSKL